jgi:hypothetical protein
MGRMEDALKKAAEDRERTRAESGTTPSTPSASVPGRRAIASPSRRVRHEAGTPSTNASSSPRLPHRRVRKSSVGYGPTSHR